VAATRRARRSKSGPAGLPCSPQGKLKAGSTVLLAALALPGLTPDASAENPPETATLSYKQLRYHDWQPGLDRVNVSSPSVFLEVPVGEQFALSGSAVLDSVSGASPRYYTTVSGASRMHDERRAYDGHVTWFRPRSAYGVSYSNSSEHDYVSHAAALDARFASEDNNTTVNLGAGGSDDTINPVNRIVTDRKKRTVQAVAGVTQDLTPSDLVQLQLGYSRGGGYFSDPYKLSDHRPDARDQGTAVARWNHHFDSLTLRSSYRYYADSWRVRAHGVGFEVVEPLGGGLALTPALSYYTQSAARFYLDPGPGGALPVIPAGMESSLDQRLSAFGALTAGMKLEWRIGAHWTTDLKGEYYQQRSEWRLLGQGSPGLDPFYYYAAQFGLAYRF